MLSTLVNRLAPSATLAMSQKSAELKAQGVDIINLSVGEPDFNTPDHIKEAAKKAVDENYSRYSPVAGYPALRKAICAKLQNENGLTYAPEQIVVIPKETPNTTPKPKAKTYESAKEEKNEKSFKKPKENKIQTENKMEEKPNELNKKPNKKKFKKHKKNG